VLVFLAGVVRYFSNGLHNNILAVLHRSSQSQHLLLDRRNKVKNTPLDWFVPTLTDLVNGTLSTITEQNTISAQYIVDFLIQQESSGFAHLSRRHWWTIKHPTLGYIQWIHNKDAAEKVENFSLMIRGKRILRILNPNRLPAFGSVRWIAPKAKENFSFAQRGVMEEFLATRPENRHIHLLLNAVGGGK